jgi:hypothetical protein
LSCPHSSVLFDAPLVGLNGTKQIHLGYKVFLGSPKASNYFAVQILYYRTEQKDQANQVENG